MVDVGDTDIVPDGSVTAPTPLFIVALSTSPNTIQDKEADSP